MLTVKATLKNLSYQQKEMVRMETQVKYKIVIYMNDSKDTAIPLEVRHLLEHCIQIQCIM